MRRRRVEPLARTAEGRVRVLVDAPARAAAGHVLYWMTATRRLRSNFALDRAVAWAKRLDLPLAILEPVGVGHRFASERFHAFILAGMREHARALEGSAVAYHPHVERAPRESAGLLAAWADDAAVVIADDNPGFFHPRLIAAAARRLEVRLEAVDSNGLLPIRSPGRAFGRAVDFRRHLQKVLPATFDAFPRRRALASRLRAHPGIPRAIARRWPVAERAVLEARGDALATLPIDHDVSQVAETPGGEGAARRRLLAFVTHDLARYAEDRDHPDRDATSRLSPYLHFGHLAAHDVVAAVLEAEGWTPARFTGRADGKRLGWWGASAGAETFLDQLVTWRELAYNTAVEVSRFASWGALPAWARATLEKHADDPREDVYPLARLEAGDTLDPVWNAAQGELLERGSIHNRARMLWGKRIVEWTPTPRQAFARMLHLNDKYALDGRDATSVAGIAWVLGRYDRPWPPERPVLGTVRPMSSERLRSRFDAEGWIARWTPDPRRGRLQAPSRASAEG